MPTDPTPPSGAQAPALPVEAIRWFFDAVRAATWEHYGGYISAAIDFTETDLERAESQLTALLQAVEEGRKDTVDAKRWRFFRQFLTVEQDIDSGVEFLFLHDDRVQEVELPLTGETTVEQLVDKAIDAARTPDPAREEGAR